MIPPDKNNVQVVKLQQISKPHYVMASIILLNKPFQVLCQFNTDDKRTTLKTFLPDHPGYYPAGRLDYDSEGLLILTSNGKLQNRISDPKHKLRKTYWVQVEGIPDTNAIEQLRKGVELKDGLTRPATAQLIREPDNLWPRSPAIRERKAIPTQWLELSISEGRNRQVRRMTAAIGHPTLRLIRASIGDWHLQQMRPGDYRFESAVIPPPGPTRLGSNKPQRRTRKP